MRLRARPTFGDRDEHSEISTQPQHYFADVTPKKYVVRHGTAGRTHNTPANGKPGVATTSIDAWTRDEQRVGAPYVVDRDRDYETADAELQMIRSIGASPDVHMLVGAVEKKVRRRR